MDLVSSPAAGSGGVQLKRRVVWATLASLLGVGAVALLITGTGPRAVLAALGDLHLGAILAALLLKFVALAGFAQVYRQVYLVAGGEPDRLPYRAVLPIGLGHFSLTQVLPGGGVAGGVYAARRLSTHGTDRATAATTVLLFGTVHMGTLALMVGLSTMVASLVSDRYTGYVVASLVATAMFAAGITLVHGMATRPAWRAWAVARLERMHWRERAVGATWATSLARPPAALQHPLHLVRPAAWSAATWTVDVTVLALLVYAAGGRPPFLGILLAFAATHLLAGLPTTPGGLGVVEAGMAGTLIAFGTDPAVASLTALCYRGTASLVPVLVASPLVLRASRRSNRVLADPLLPVAPPDVQEVPA